MTTKQYNEYMYAETDKAKKHDINIMSTSQVAQENVRWAWYKKTDMFTIDF